MRHLLITLEVQDGERRHTVRNLHTTKANDINFAAERYAASYWGHGTRDNCDEWWWINGEFAIRVFSCVELSKADYVTLSKAFHSTTAHKPLVKIILSDDDREYFKVYHVNKHEIIDGECIIEGSLVDCVELVEGQYELVNKKEVEDWGINKRIEIRNKIIKLLSSLGMDMPNNLTDIVDFVYNDVCETANQTDWSDADVVIGLRRWMEWEV